MAGKFDDLEKFLKGKRKPLKPEAKGKKGMFDEMIEKVPFENEIEKKFGGMTPQEMVAKLKSALGKEFGDGFELGDITPVSSGDLESFLKGKEHRGHVHKIAAVDGIRKDLDIHHAIAKLATSFEGMMGIITTLFEEKKSKPFCKDGKGSGLKVGDVLDAGGGMTKTVMELGYGYCRLSHTDDPTEDDGIWFETEIAKHKFIKK